MLSSFWEFLQWWNHVFIQMHKLKNHWLTVFSENTAVIIMLWNFRETKPECSAFNSCNWDLHHLSHLFYWVERFFRILQSTRRTLQCNTLNKKLFQLCGKQISHWIQTHTHKHTNKHTHTYFQHLYKIAFSDSILNCVCPFASFASLFDRPILVIKQSLGSLCLRKGVDSKSAGALYSHPACWQNH